MKKIFNSYPLLPKALLFTLLFVTISGIIGPYIIGTKLLYGYSFYIYGNLGKLVIFSLVLFFVLTRDKLSKLKVTQLNLLSFLWFLEAGLLLALFFKLASFLLGSTFASSILPLVVLTHIILIMIPVSLLIGVFGLEFLKKFVRLFKKELGICLGLSIVLFFAIFQIWKLWPYLSSMVLASEYFIYSHIFQNVYVIAPYGLFVNSFVVKIEEACSGLESIFLFTVLYLFIAILDKAKLNTKRALLFFPFLLLGLVLVNIIRVFLLILVGVLINPQLMATLFHTYIGLILFVLYFLLFLRYVYKYLLN